MCQSDSDRPALSPHDQHGDGEGVFVVPPEALDRAIWALDEWIADGRSDRETYESKKIGVINVIKAAFGSMARFD